MNRLLIFLAVFTSLILPAEAQELWAKTTAGMSVAEVREIYPNAVPPSSPVSSSPETEVLLTIPSVKVEDQTYRVAFFFRDEKLDKVALNHTGKQSFESQKLLENVEAFVSHIKKVKPAAAKGTYIKKVCISATMSPAVMLDYA